MTSKEECMRILVERFPGFSDRWRAHLEWWGEEEAGLCNDVAAFGRYVGDLIVEGDTSDVAAIFGAIEELLLEGDAEVKDAVATCCLENLLNSVSSGRIAAGTFVHLLGPQSRAYCRAWDEFTGVRTPEL